MLTLTPHLEMVTRLNKDRNQRYADTQTVIDQIGRMTIMACAGTMKHVHVVRNTEKEPCGIIMWLGTNRACEVVLDWNDTYSVRRYRIITKGQKAGTIETEVEHSDIYCDQLSDVVYTASCWK